ncbi:BIG/ATPase V1 complex, subunit S1 [Biscogniauxia mediterranea]|nr:BIG/ATPase V1 complex, subunit S1 [Biscogniauxia mediterranea]
MRLSVPATVAALYASAQAFSDSSPFILFSTAKIPSANLEQQQQPQLQSSAQVLSSTKQLLSSCPTDRYVLVSQPGLNAARHLRSRDAVPRLRTALDAAASRYTVAEVVDDDDGLDLRLVAQYIRETCGVPASAVDEIELSPVDGAKTLRENDDELGLVLGQYDAEGSYTVLYMGGPRTEIPGTYTADFEDSVHTELKRQLQGVVRRAGESNSKLGLFDKYQFFTPGIFMALVVFIVLMSMLYAGISAVASLEVSYGAFDKENGPAAQKKAQ